MEGVFQVHPILEARLARIAFTPNLVSERRLVMMFEAAEDYFAEQLEYNPLDLLYKKLQIINSDHAVEDFEFLYLRFILADICALAQATVATFNGVIQCIVNLKVDDSRRRSVHVSIIGQMPHNGQISTYFSSFNNDIQYIHRDNNYFTVRFHRMISAAYYLERKGVQNFQNFRFRMYPRHLVLNEVQEVLRLENDFRLRMSYESSLRQRLMSICGEEWRRVYYYLSKDYGDLYLRGLVHEPTRLLLEHAIDVLWYNADVPEVLPNDNV